MQVRLLPKRKNTLCSHTTFGCDVEVKIMLTAEAVRLGVSLNHLVRSLAYDAALAVQHNHPQLEQLPDVFSGETK